MVFINIYLFVLAKTIARLVVTMNNKVITMGFLNWKFKNNRIIIKIKETKEIKFNRFFQDFISSLHKLARNKPVGKPSNIIKT